MTEYARGDTVRVSGYRGIAFYVVGPEMEAQPIGPDDFGDDWDFVDTGNLIVCMVGDDRHHSIDPDDITPLDDDEYCGSCGQIGCGWH